ncbi:Protein NRDE2-like protein [Erysiphe neolycopersici]|uniref:Protein NRDE2-like protein n=1 Tax=Erysiphe neolycopersici TaxID=212602 RepID=A0A420HW98_9PEZI|nr:Protein NRDE2-like protein [Erysiphe neolycopersici]
MPNLRNIEVPKFTSYKPKPAVETRVLNESKIREKCKNKLKTRQKDVSQTQTERYFSERTNSDITSSSNISSQQIYPRDISTDCFLFDRKGDRDNLVYGAPHKYSIPKYHRYGAGQVLGASQNLKINRELGDEKYIVLSYSGYNGYLSREKYIFSRVERQKPVVIKPRPRLLGEDYTSANFDFISLQPNENSSKIRNDKEFSDDEDGENNLSKIAVSKSQSNFISETDCLDLVDNQHIDKNLSARKKNAALRLQVEMSPTDIEAWLLLIDHQDHLIQNSDDCIRISQAMIKSIADVKVHLYEKALQHCDSLENRERLLVGLMSEGEKLWELKALANRWEQISKNNIDSLFLWTKYLEFKQFNLPIFRYEQVKKLYLQRIKYLTEAAKIDQENSEKYFYELNFVLLRATIFIREAGYSELAIAIWQSNLEINFCAPNKDCKYDDRITNFREFWESEVPRIGEIGAKGWRYHVETADAYSTTNLSIDETTNFLDKNNLFQSWVVAERLRSRSSRIPAKTLDEVVEDDPFRVILFTDIQDFLCILPSKYDNIYRSFIDKFLAFCSLQPLVNLDGQKDNAFNIDNFVRIEYDWLESDCSDDIKQSGYDVKDTTIAPIPRFVPSSESLFYDTIKLKEKSKPYRARFPEDSGPVTYSFVRNSLKQLIQNWFDPSLAEYYLSFEFKNEPDTIKKTSKALLKQNPFTFRLYNAYALVEWCSGNKKAAEGVFSVALNNGNSNVSSSAAGDLAILLWKSWIWICLEDGDSDKALKYLICIADGHSKIDFDVSPAIILRTRQHLTFKQDSFLSKNSVIALNHNLLTILGLALLEYLSCSTGQDSFLDIQRNITEAMKNFRTISQILHERNQKTSHQLLLQSASRLLFYHCQRGSYSPAFVREYLTDFLQKFPQNTIFISFYSWNESRLRIDDRVRNLLHSNVLVPQNDTLTSRLFAIRHEIKIGNLHSTKAAFEDSVSSPVTKYSAELWKLYILYCLKIPQLQRDAKSVWYRAIRTCPSVKEIYILGFEKLGGSMEYSELKRVWKTMEEKELRIHVNLEDEFDEIECKGL